MSAWHQMLGESFTIKVNGIQVAVMLTTFTQVDPLPNAPANHRPSYRQRYKLRLRHKLRHRPINRQH